MNDPPESGPPPRVIPILDRPVALVFIGGLLLLLIAWLVQDRYWVLQQRALAQLAVLNARIGSAQETQDDLVSRVGDYLTAEGSIVDAYEDQLDERGLRDTIAAADKVLDEWNAHEETLKLRLLTRFHQDDVQTAFSSLLTQLDTLADDVDEVRDLAAAESLDDQDDAIDRCREDIDAVEQALASLSVTMSRYIDRLAAPPAQTPRPVTSR